MITTTTLMTRTSSDEEMLSRMLSDLKLCDAAVSACEPSVDHLPSKLSLEAAHRRAVDTSERDWWIRVALQGIILVELVIVLLTCSSVHPILGVPTC